MHRTSVGCESAVKVIVTLCEGLREFHAGRSTLEAQLTKP